MELGYLVAIPLLGALISLLSSGKGYVSLLFAVFSFMGSLYYFYVSLRLRELVYQWLGGWTAPLGIGLRLDGLSGLFLLMTGLVCFLVAIYSTAFFRATESSKGPFFWFLLFFLWAGMNAFYLSEDLFNLYVALEVLSLTAVLLVALPRSRKALIASYNYLILSILASMLYLFGVAIIYTGYGTLSMHMLSERMNYSNAYMYALVPVVIALALKSALFPFHFWLPSAHASTIAPASALLSALVVKPPAYLLLRLWVEVLPEAQGVENLSWVLGTMGMAAVISGSYLAIKQSTIKMLLAYSTVAQMGYLFLLVPLYYQAQLKGLNTMVLEGFAIQALSHALAKASMFLSSGNAIYVARRDELSYMPGFAHSHPFTFFSLFFSGATLIGLPLSGGFVAKFLLLKASLQTGLFLQGVVLLVGSLMAAVYIYSLWKESFSYNPEKIHDQPIPRLMELSALILGFISFSLGLVSGFLLQGITGRY